MTASATAIFAPFHLKLITCGVFSKYILQRTHGLWFVLFCFVYECRHIFASFFKVESLSYFCTWVRSCELYCLYLDTCWHLRNLTVGPQALSLKKLFKKIFSACTDFNLILKIIILPCPVLFAIEIGVTIEGASGIWKFSWQFNFSLLHLTDLVASWPCRCLLKVR